MNNRPTLYLTQGSGNSFKPKLVLSQTNQECLYRYIDVLAGETRKPEFLHINPQGVVPYLSLANGTGLGESNAIAWYFAEGTTLMPESRIARAQTVRWMNFEQTALEANISPVRFFTYIAPELGKEHQEMIPVWRERGEQGLGVLNDYLADRSFITDDGYSVADISVFGYTHLAEEGGFNLSEYPAIARWIERVQNEPGYQSIQNLLDGNSTEVSQAA